jgi:trk system potassium uptake protein TrkH
MPLFRRFRVLRTERRHPAWLDVLRAVAGWATLVAAVVFVSRFGYRLSYHGLVLWLMTGLNGAVILLALADIVLTWFFVPSWPLYLRRRWFDFVLLVPILVLLFLGLPAYLPAFLRQFIVSVQNFARSRRFLGLVERLRIQPVQTLALSFVGLIVLGTFVLTFPASTTDGRGAPLLTALFTATSGVCVTGLIVVDTATYFSRFGQYVILVLLQLGGLGIMSFSASVIVLLRRRLGPGERSTLAVGIEDARDLDIAKSVRYILLFTLLAEVLGALGLFVRWLFDFQRPADALFHAVFHSVSAFCNAGFSTFSDSLIRYQADIPTNLVVCSLILLGGLGFGVVHELISRGTLKRGLARTWNGLSTHAYLVTRTSLLLVVLGALAFFFFEFDNSLAGLSPVGKVLAAIFQSVTPRTAGFNTVPFAGLRPVTLLIVTVLMFVGASPGGTGGGVKTSTLAVLWFVLRGVVLGRAETEVRGRTIGRDTVYRVGVIVGAGLALVALFLGILLITERAPFQDLLFETMSAFGTVGLSTGVTPNLSVPGRLAIIALMYIGRLGPLTLAMTMAARRSRLAVSYPSARVLVG